MLLLANLLIGGGGLWFGYVWTKAHEPRDHEHSNPQSEIRNHSIFALTSGSG